MKNQIITAILISCSAMTSSALDGGKQNDNRSSTVFSLCQAMALVKAGDHQTVTISAIYTSGLEDSFLYDPKCHDGAPSTWVEFVPKLKSRDKLQRIATHSMNRAYVQFEGELFSPKPINPDTSLPEVLRNSGGRYGHLGGYPTMMLVKSIHKIDPVPADVPFFQWATATLDPVAQSAETSAVTLPTISRADVPLYPPMARIAGIVGTVQIDVTLKDGTVYDTMLTSEAPPMLVSASMANVKTWKFESTANVTFRVKYVYEISEGGTTVEGNPKVEMQLPNLIKITAQLPKLTSNY